MKRGVVIGAGIAGLAVATRLRRLGYDVQVLEKNKTPGGKIAKIEYGGYTWDAGPSFFTDRKEFERLFKEARKDPAKYIKIKELNEACRYFYEDGRVLHGYDTPKKLAKEFEQVFGEPRMNVERYLAQAKQIYTVSGKYFLNTNFTLSSLLKPSAVKGFARLPTGLIGNSVYHRHNEVFKTADAMNFFDRFATYNGSNPKQAPALLTCMPHLEHNLGAYYIDGGMYELAKAAERLALDSGVKIHYEREVTKITHRQNKVTGVITDQGWEEADVVVSAGDISWVYRELIHPHQDVVKYLKRVPSSSAIIFCWGIKKKFPKLFLHNIFFSANYPEHNRRLWEDSVPPEDPTIYINITSKMNRKHAPVGHENWFVMVNVPARTGQSDWLSRTRGQVIQKLNRMLNQDIENLIEQEVVLGPDHFASQYHANQGSLYGAASNSWRGAFFRHPNQSPEFSNLYFTGVTVHPGGGIPLALRSSRIAAAMIEKNER